MRHSSASNTTVKSKILSKIANTKWKNRLHKKCSQVSLQKILTTIMMYTVVTKSTDHTKPLSIYLLPPHWHHTKHFFQCVTIVWPLCDHCVTHWCKQCCLYSYRQGQIGQLDCNMTANCGEKIIEYPFSLIHSSALHIKSAYWFNTGPLIGYFIYHTLTWFSITLQSVSC